MSAAQLLIYLDTGEIFAADCDGQPSDMLVAVLAGDEPDERDVLGNLFAAAPDLLEALAEADRFIDELIGKISTAVYASEELKNPEAFKNIDAFKFDGNGASMRDMIAAAIAKARG